MMNNKLMVIASVPLEHYEEMEQDLCSGGSMFQISFRKDGRVRAYPESTAVQILKIWRTRAIATA